ncbi:MAG TPA: hypothetical protein VL099_13100 [Candidatus Binatia bacterium]|nr:hypothetical protein [Candidatus Binatia bacterium]
MNKRLLAAAAVVLSGGFALAAGQAGTWTGQITDSHCGYKAKHTAACVNMCVMDHGAKYALASPDDKKLYILEPQEKAAPLANETVKVTGTISGDTIQIKTIEKVSKPS